MTLKEIEQYEKLQAQLEGLHNEMGFLSKKSPGDGVNKFKLKLINKIIAEINLFLKEDYRPFADFGSFDEDTLPTNSDVVLILAQYLNCLEKLRADNINYRYHKWLWNVSDDAEIQIQTAPPKKIQEK